jgi:tRNA (cmo5U34)-methyltransferase
MALVGDGITSEPGTWSFGGQAAAAFDQHAVRSIPFYASCHELIAGIADVVLGPGMVVYDLGCSTGALAELLANRVRDRGVRIVGVDREPDMLDRARARCGASATFIEADIATLTFEPCDLVIAYYTLQFVARDQRPGIVRRISHALRPGGAFLCFDKVLAADARSQDLATAVYHDWKRAQGFDDAEIASKDRGLRGILRPLTSAEEVAILRGGGFDDVQTIFRWMGWEGYLARR